MADEKKDTNGLLGVLPMGVIVTLLATLTLTSVLPYRDQRPTARPISSQYTAAQDINARLWQDPFADIDSASDNAVITVEQGHNSYKYTLQEKASSIHDESQVMKGKTIKDSNVITVLAILLPGGRYQENAEQRMRYRYAVLSALANQQWTPDDEQHIGYFNASACLDKDKNCPPLNNPVAFEWWTNENESQKTLLLWVNDDDMKDSPHAKLTQLFKKVSKKIKPSLSCKIKKKVIGPNSSTLLLKMMRDSQEKIQNICSNACESPFFHFSLINESQLLKILVPPNLLKKNEFNLPICYSKRSDINYYSPVATASDKELLGIIYKNCLNINFSVSNYFYTNAINLYRTTATDDSLMASIADELKLRRIEHNDTVVILSEWDTFYGRSMPKAFKDHWKELNDNSEHALVYEYAYMRGLDGVLPDNGDNKSEPSDKQNDDTDQNPLESTRKIETPEGVSQKDYLRRLVNHIETMDKAIKSKGLNNGIAAFGVLGSDVHDKIMIIQALRAVFPHKLIFTSGLDADYFHPANLPYTRNLLVTSPFSLRLRDELQGKIPSFRDSNQTAIYATTQAILIDDNDETKINALQSKPLIFEIGLSQAIQLKPEENKNNTASETEKSNSIVNNKDSKPECGWDQDKFNKCIDIQPNLDDTNVLSNSTYYHLYKNISYLIIIAIIIIAILLSTAKPLRTSIKRNIFFYLISAFIISFITLIDYRIFIIVCCSSILLYITNPALRKSKYIEDLTLWIFIFFSIFILLYIICNIFNPNNYFNSFIQSIASEPLVWSEGVSIWPSQILRLLACAISIVFIGYGNERIEEMIKNLGTTASNKTFYLDPTTTVSETYHTTQWEEEIEKAKNPTTPNVNPDNIWSFYKQYYDNQLTRVILYSVGLGFVFAFILVIGGEWPSTPARGDLAFTINNWILIVSVISTLVITLWSFDNAKLCFLFIDHLSAQPSNWNANAIIWLQREFNINQRYVNEWLDIRIVAKLTDGLQWLSFGPFMCIALMVAARSPMIDDWNLPWPLVIIFVTLLLLLIYAQALLQWGAIKARRKTIDLLNKQIRVIHHSAFLPAPASNNVSIQIEAIEAEIKEINALREGAFRPWYEWPFLQAIGGLSSLLVGLQYLAQAWLAGQL